MYKVNNLYLPDSDTYFQKFFEDEGGFQLDHLRKILEHVDQFSLAIDGGAHVGTWTKLMAEHFDMVYAFEPAPDTYKCLAKNVLPYFMEDKVKLFNTALGEKNDFITVMDDDSRKGNTGSRFIKGYSHRELSKTTAFMTTIDDLKISSPLGLLKLDLEGYEYYALLGARKTIEKYKPVIVIEKKLFKGRYPHSYIDAEQLLREFGMKNVCTVGNDAIYKFV